MPAFIESCGNSLGLFTKSGTNPAGKMPLRPRKEKLPGALHRLTDFLQFVGHEQVLERGSMPGHIRREPGRSHGFKRFREGRRSFCRHPIESFAQHEQGPERTRVAAGSASGGKPTLPQIPHMLGASGWRQQDAEVL